MLAEILTEGDSKIAAGSVNLNSSATYALRNTISGAALGLGALAGDISIIQLGNRKAISSGDRDTKGGVNDALKTVKDGYDKAANYEVANKEKEAEAYNKEVLITNR